MLFSLVLAVVQLSGGRALVKPSKLTVMQPLQVSEYFSPAASAVGVDGPVVFFVPRFERVSFVCCTRHVARPDRSCI